jgi:hypothetical protein
LELDGPGSAPGIAELYDAGRRLSRGAAAKHGRNGRRGWKKLHPGVDATGVIAPPLGRAGNEFDRESHNR